MSLKKGGKIKYNSIGTARTIKRNSLVDFVLLEAPLYNGEERTLRNSRVCDLFIS